MALTSEERRGSGVASLEQYNFEVVRKFTVMTLVWALVGMGAGFWIAGELAFPQLNFNVAEITFGRLRAVHTSAVLFGFAANALFATSYYVVQRTCQTRLHGDRLAAFTFWGWNVTVALGMLSHLFGYSQSREYAEFEWPFDIAIAVVWVVYAWVFIQTLRRRSQPHIYVANWFYLAFILAVGLLHVFNNLAVPVCPACLKSYPLFSGVQDAMTQWW